MAATKYIRVLVTFTQSDHQIEEIAGAVITGMTSNKNYPNAPVDLADMEGALTVFTAAIATQVYTTRIHRSVTSP